MATLNDLIARAERLNKEQQRLIAELKGLRKLQASRGSRRLKHPDGKLTEEGVRQLQAGFKAGQSSSELARSLGITVPAVLYRRKAWEAQRGRKGGK